MPRSLSPIPAETAIVERGGSISAFFRLRWQELLDAFQLAATRANVSATGQTAAIVTTTAYVAQQGAVYRLSWYLRKTIADGVASSVTLTFGWTDLGAALTAVGAALATDTTTANQTGSILVRADALSALTYAVAYSSNTPAKMTFDLRVTVEQHA